MCLDPAVSRLRKTRGRKFDKVTQKWTITDLRGYHENQKVVVPCGKCAECQAKKRHDWAFRLYWEALDHPTTHMITLTYNDDSLPWLDKNTGETIRGEFIKLAYLNNDIDTRDTIEAVPLKEDLAEFIRIIRRKQQYLYSKKEARIATPKFFAVSEYGAEKNRPHYHLIYFGLEQQIADEIKNGKHWLYGFTDVRPMTDRQQKNFYYLTKYLYKQKYDKSKAVPPFSMMSKNPYLGKRFERHVLKHLTKESTFKIPGIEWQFVPRIYRRKLADIKQQVALKKMLAYYDVEEEKQIAKFAKKGQSYYRYLYQQRHHKLREHNKELKLL